METNTTTSGRSRGTLVAPGALDGLQRGVFVIATTVRATQHALDVARTLAHGQGQDVTVLVSSPEHATITSARAHVYHLPVEFPEPPDRATEDAVRHLVADEDRNAVVRVTDARDARSFAKALPPSATVVLAGPIHRFVETREQRLARELNAFGYDVVFLPCRPAEK
jgi:hypothetical protein